MSSSSPVLVEHIRMMSHMGYLGHLQTARCRRRLVLAEADFVDVNIGVMFSSSYAVELPTTAVAKATSNSGNVA